MEGRHCEDLLKAQFVRDLGELSFVGKKEPVTPFIAHISVTEEPATRGQNRCRDEICVSAENASGKSPLAVPILKHSSEY